MPTTHVCISIRSMDSKISEAYYSKITFLGISIAQPILHHNVRSCTREVKLLNQLVLANFLYTAS